MHKMIFILFLLALSGNLSLAQTVNKDSVTIINVKPRGYSCVIQDPIEFKSFMLYNFDNFLTSTKNRALIIDAGVQSGSNYLPSELAYKLYSGGEIDESVRLSTLNSNHYSILRFGAIAGYNAKCFLGFINERYNSHKHYGRFRFVPLNSELNIGSSTILNALLQPNIATLYFLGNGVFANQTAILGPSNLELIQLNSIGFNQNFFCNKYGIDPELISVKNLLNFSVGFQLNQLQNYKSISIENGNLFTAPYGQYLDLSYSLRIKDNQNQHPIGLGLNFGMTKNIRNITLGASAQNVGFWKVNRMSTLSADTSFRYQGIVLQTWGQNPQLPNDTLKSILGLHSSTTHDRIWLPGFVKMQVRYGNVWRIDMSYYFTLHALPLLEWKYIRWSDLYRKQLRYSIIPNIGYGGFGTYHVGFMSGVQYKKVSIMLNVNDLQTLALKNQSSFSVGLKAGFGF